MGRASETPVGIPRGVQVQMLRCVLEYQCQYVVEFIHAIMPACIPNTSQAYLFMSWTVVLVFSRHNTISVYCKGNQLIILKASTVPEPSRHVFVGE